LSLETCGRLWVLVIPRSESRNATDLDVIADPRSAWTVSCSRPPRCLVQISQKDGLSPYRSGWGAATAPLCLSGGRG
jgi:hypothetical protein